jgi:hypothetical protein
LSRALHKRDSELAQEVARLRGELAESPAGQAATALADRALAVLERGLDSDDPKLALDCAKAILSKGHGEAAAGAPGDPSAPLVVSAAEALHELARAVEGARVLFAEAGAQAVNELASACSALVAKVTEQAATGTTTAAPTTDRVLN